jgi:ATP-binding cassette subfamily C (CFTR/MRP) protein 1
MHLRSTCIVTVLVSIPISQRSNEAISRWIERVQDRLSATSSMLHDMKAVKMLGLSDRLFDYVSQLRIMELQVSERFRKLLIGQVLLCRMKVHGEND